MIVHWFDMKCSKILSEVQQGIPEKHIQGTPQEGLAFNKFTQKVLPGPLKEIPSGVSPGDSRSEVFLFRSLSASFHGNSW